MAKSLLRTRQQAQIGITYADLCSISGSGRPPGEGNGNPLLPGKSHGQRSLVGYSPWGQKESDMTEQLHIHLLPFMLPPEMEC